MMVLEKNVYEKQIEQARSKYALQINKLEVQSEKLRRKNQKIEVDDNEHKQETITL